jgi:outer membrane immunogenic protein
MRVAGFDWLRTRGSVRAVPWFTPAGSGPDASGVPMKKIVSAGIGLLALTGMATAADLPVKAPVYKAPPVIVDPWTWTGVYVGLNAGYSWGKSQTDVSYFNTVTGLPIAPPAGSITSVDFKLNGGVAGGQIGYNWQSGIWVGGIEADLQWSGQKGSAFFNCAIVGGGGVPGPCLPGLTFTPPGATGATLAFDQKLQWFGTLRGRLGVTPAPTVLLYVTGGLAYGEIKTEGAFSSFIGINTVSVAAFSQSTTKSGWTVGGGIEGRLSGNWTGKIEYLYMDLGTVSGTVVNTPALIGANWSSHITDNIVRVGLNYKFGPYPVIAKY